MRVTALALFAAAAFGLGAAPALSQNDAGGQPAAAQPSGQDAKAILRDAQKAAKELKSVTYKADATAAGPFAAMFPNVKADVSMARLEQPGNVLGGRVSIDGEISPQGQAPKKFTLSYDGTTARNIDHAAKKVLEAKDAAALGALMEFVGSSGAAAVIFTPFMQDDAFNNELEAPFVTLTGNADVGGVACDVVEVRYESEDSGPSAKISFGRADRLARKVVWSIPMGEQGDGSVTVALSDVKRNPELADAVFARAIPEGYTVEEFKARSQPSDNDEPALLAVGTPAPDWTLKDRDGKDVQLSKLKGKVVVLDFWATWCGPCKQAMPSVQKLHEKFKDKGVLVYGVNTWEGTQPGDPAKYMDDKSYTYGLLMGGDSVAGEYQVTGIPTFYVIGADGKILFNAVGFEAGADEKIGAVIEKHLQEQAGGGK